MSANEVHGVGLFCGRGGRVRLEMPPRGASGLWISRPDVAAGVGPVPISVAMVAGPGADHSGWMRRSDGRAIPVPPRNTTLVLSGTGASGGSGAVVAATVEHVLSALAGLGVWDACVVLEGDEVPIDDGSAKAFVELARHLKHAGVGGMGAADVEPIVLRERIEVCDAGGAWIVGEPLDGIEYAYELDYGAGAPLGAQRVAWRGDSEEYVREIAPARTFSLRAEAEMARAAGLFGHLTPAEMVVVGDDGVPMANAWRMEHEPARHKLLDLIGDLALLGRPLHARVTAHRSGHAMTHEFCRRVMG